MVEQVSATSLDLSGNAVWNRMGGSDRLSTSLRLV